MNTGHARVTPGIRDAARRNLDENVPQTCPFPAQVTQRCGNPFRFQRDAYEKKTPTCRKMEDAWYQYKITAQKERPGNRLTHSRRKKKRTERTPRNAIHAPKPRRLCPDGLPLRTVRVRRNISENVPKCRKYNYIYTPRGRTRHTTAAAAASR